jgi:hypothetical protein
MRFLRIPIVSEDAQQLPDWVIGDLNREGERHEERREAPRLERPESPPPPPPRAPEPERTGGTVIVFDI